MRTTRIAIGSILALGGAVWTLQGFNATFVPTSFMTGSTAWIVIGVATFAVGVTILVRNLR